MSDWGTSNTAADAPKFVNTMRAAGYANTFNVDVIAITPDAASAGPGTLHTGWAYRKAGTGAVVGFNITNGGTLYANTDTFTVSGGTTPATGTVTTDGAGVITALNIVNGGSFTGTGTLSITTATGSGAVATPVFGGKAGRVQMETFVATVGMSAS